MTKEKASIFLG